jgi:hypothetical protein
MQYAVRYTNAAPEALGLYSDNYFYISAKPVSAAEILD